MNRKLSAFLAVPLFALSVAVLAQQETPLSMPPQGGAPVEQPVPQPSPEEKPSVSSDQPPVIIDSGGSLQSASPAGVQPMPQEGSSGSAALGAELPQAPNPDQPRRAPAPPPQIPSVDSTKVQPQSKLEKKTAPLNQLSLNRQTKS